MGIREHLGRNRVQEVLICVKMQDPCSWLGKFQGSLCWRCLSFLPEKEGIRLSPSTYQSLLHASWHRDSAPLQVKALYIIYIYTDWIICRHHKAAGLKYVQ